MQHFYRTSKSDWIRRDLIKSSRQHPSTFSMCRKYTILQSFSSARGEQMAPLSHSAEDRCGVVRGRNSAWQAGQPICWAEQSEYIITQCKVRYIIGQYCEVQRLSKLTPLFTDDPLPFFTILPLKNHNNSHFLVYNESAPRPIESRSCDVLDCDCPLLETLLSSGLETCGQRA